MTNTSQPNLTEVILRRGKHRNAQQLLFFSPYDTNLKSTLKHDLSARWSKTLGCWYVANTPNNLRLAYSKLGNICKVTSALDKEVLLGTNKTKIPRTRNLSTEQRDFLNGFYKFLKGKRYSKNTVEVYSYLVADFVEFCKGKPIDSIVLRDVQLFVESVVAKRPFSISTHRQFVSALKQLKLYAPEISFDQVNLTRPKRSKKLPVVLSPEKVISLIQVAKNLKHRLVMGLIYSCGLRISELLNLKVAQIDIERRQLMVKRGKGRKDRYVTLSESLMPLLFNYLETYKPNNFLIEGSNGKSYSASSVRKFMAKYAIQAKIKKRVSPHVLRHSYATHLLEQGVGLRHLQELLGHAKPETTMIYTHVTRKDLLDIRSPLDYAVANYKKRISGNKSSLYPDSKTQ